LIKVKQTEKRTVKPAISEIIVILFIEKESSRNLALLMTAL